jgi:hypothetical protein
VIRKVALPRAAAFNEGLHQSALGLHSVHQIVRRPLVHQLVERDRAKLLVDDLARQIVRGEAVKQAQAVGAQYAKFAGQGRGCRRAPTERVPWLSGSKASKLRPASKARVRGTNTKRSASIRCCKQFSADHWPGAAGRLNRSAGSDWARWSQREAVVARTALAEGSRFSMVRCPLFRVGDPPTFRRG